MGSNYLRLADRSALEILTLDENSYQTFLTEGRVYANFRGSKDSLLQIDTSTSSVQADERSKFNVDVLERGPVNVAVYQGEVYVENRDGRIGVKEGETLSLGEGIVSEKSTLGSPDDWESWNWERDSKIAERRPPSRHLPEELQPYSNDFYDNGRWVHTPDYGYVWTPTVSVSVGWAPYRSGRWVWMGGDYVWVSYEPWGWAPYHYGRWAFAVSIGWCWVPPARGAVYWGPGYVGWVYTSRRVAWVPLAPGDIYYGRGHHGPHSVNITNVHVTNVHVGNPLIKPGKTSVMPVVREVPQAKRPPEPVKRVNVRELKEQRPMVKGKDASVFAPETRPREMPFKAGEAKPIPTKSEREKELRQPSRKTGEPRPSAPSDKRVGQPGPTATTVQTPKESKKSESTLERTKQDKPTPAGVQEQKQPAPADKGRSQPRPSEPAVRTPKETRTPERGTDRRMESRSPEKVTVPARPPERVKQKSKEVSPPEKGIQQAPELKTPEKPMERPSEPKNSEKGPQRP